jgi:protein-tyrosine phosphatase
VVTSDDLANGAIRMTTTLPPPTRPTRHVAVPGTYNMRDLGGFPAADGRMTRWQTLYRADALHRLDDESHRVLREIGVRTVVDLRGDAEVRRAPSRLGSLDIHVVRQPLFGPRASVATLGVPRRTLTELYAHVVDDRPAVLAAVVQRLAAARAVPAIVHCTIGKDRTGMVVAVILSLLGVDDEVIARDFAETEQYLCGAFREELVAHHSEGGLSLAEVEAMLAVDPTCIWGFLARIHARYGGVPGLLTRHGVTEDELRELRERLLTERDEACVTPPAVPPTD